MSDANGTALAALAAALAPYLAQHLGIGGQGNPQAQAGANFGGAQQAPNVGFQQPQTVQGQVATGFQQPQGQQAGNMFGAQGSQQAQGQSVTPDMIQTLITPLVQNEQVKQALTTQMQQMGINNLPDARPDQLPELYQRFQTVEQQARAAGLIGGGAGAAPSII